MEIVEVKNFELSYQGIYYISWNGMVERVYLRLNQILKMLIIEGLDVEAIDRILQTEKSIPFNKVTLLFYQYEDGYGCYAIEVEEDEKEMYFLQVGLKEDSQTMNIESNNTYNRVDKLKSAITNFSPFKNQESSSPDKLSYTNFKLLKEYFKLDITFKPDGSASLVLMNQNNDGSGNQPLKDMLKAFNLNQEFNNKAISNCHHKYFDIGDPYKNMEEVDAALVLFVQRLLNELQKLPAFK